MGMLHTPRQVLTEALAGAAASKPEDPHINAAQHIRNILRVIEDRRLADTWMGLSSVETLIAEAEAKLEEPEPEIDPNLNRLINKV